MRNITLIVAALVVTGCSSYSKIKSPFPLSGPTMLSIYNGSASTHAKKNSSTLKEGQAVKSTRRDEALPINANFIRYDDNQTTVLFPRLKNPDITVFVYPHLATSANVPIPGYTTVMPLFDVVHYAMPGEQE